MAEEASIVDRWERVRLLLEEGRLDEALGEAEHLRDESPDSVEILTLVGVVHAQRGDFESALLAFDEALAVDPDSPVAKLEKAQLFFDEERYEEALDVLAGEESPSALKLLSWSLYELGEHEEAEAALSRALSVEDAPELRHLEALLHLQRAEPTRALDSAALALELEPELAEGHHVRGLALTQLGRTEEADAAFARAAELEPESFFRPYRLSAEEFDDVVDEAIESLPEEFQQHLSNVEVSIHEICDAETAGEGLEFDLLGLYQGHTIQTESWDFPDRIMLFQRNLENVSPDRETLIEEIRDTVFHEIAHHMGMDEDAVREAEAGED